MPGEAEAIRGAKLIVLFLTEAEENPLIES